MSLNVSPQTEARLVAAARQEGLDPGIFIERLLNQYHPGERAIPLRSVDPENDASIALLESWIAAAPTDPAAIREAEEDLAEFKRNMNATRREAGARILFPQVGNE
jgi:hypothetical protein